ncbi:hypothetical protein QCA50_001752 [Cerrena zonata]|uniref:ER membrane protein complex subunit 7 beta-sandwich domain-containing protein n=1 Tax=Cerrena zonata TaxID=2478898 RepID=A0AAW0GM87_9APHY
MIRLHLLFTVFGLLCSTLAFDLKGRIVWNEVCPGINELGQAKVVLDDGKLYGGVTRSGQFVIPEVPSGTYILSVMTHDYAFERLRIDVSDTDTLPEVRPYIPGTPLSPASPVTLPYPITLHPRGKYDFYAPQESFNIIAMFKSPMMLLMLFTGVMMLAMPYIMKNMDPEMLNEFKDRQAKMQNIQSSIQNGDFKSGISAMLDDGKPAASSGVSKAQSSATPRNKGKGKRR